MGGRDFPGGSVVKNPHSSARDMGSIHSWGTKILQAVQHGQEKKKWEGDEQLNQGEPVLMIFPLT